MSYLSKCYFSYNLVRIWSRQIVISLPLITVGKFLSAGRVEVEGNDADSRPHLRLSFILGRTSIVENFLYNSEVYSE